MHSSLHESPAPSLQGELKPEYLTGAEQPLTADSHASEAHSHGLNLSKQPGQSRQSLTVGQSPVADAVISDWGSDLSPGPLQATGLQSAEAGEQQLPAQQLPTQLPGFSHRREAQQSHSASAAGVTAESALEAQQARTEGNGAMPNRPWASQAEISERLDAQFAAVDGVNAMKGGAELKASPHIGMVAVVAAAAETVAAEALAAEKTEARDLTDSSLGSNVFSAKSKQPSQAPAVVEGSTSCSTAFSAQTKPHLHAETSAEGSVDSVLGSESSSATLSAVIELEGKAEPEEEAVTGAIQEVPAEAQADLQDRDTSGLWRDVNSPVSSLGSEEPTSAQVQGAMLLPM